MLNCLREILFFFLGLLNRVVHKDAKSILLIPHVNCREDNYDILCPNSDNVLCFFHYLTSSDKYSDCLISLVYYHGEKLSDYNQFLCEHNLASRVKLVDYNSKSAFYKAFIHSAYIYTDTPYFDFRYKTSSQVVTCLGYFTPFKDDSCFIRQMGAKAYLEKAKITNKSFDYHITTSDLSSRILSVDTGLYFPKCLPLGFPRNSVFFHPDTSIRQKICSLLRRNYDRILCYTPTFRDYDIDSDDQSKRTIWGSRNSSDDEALYDYLNRNNILIIAKLHPLQEKTALMLGNTDNVVMFKSLQDKLGVSLYDLLAVSDALVTDYTSTAFDFLLGDRPVIFFWYDYEKYINCRGFSYSPEGWVCPGPVAHDIDEFISALDGLVKGKDEYASDRASVNAIMNGFIDDLACDRIAGYTL